MAEGDRQKLARVEPELDDVSSRERGNVVELPLLERRSPSFGRALRSVASACEDETSDDAASSVRRRSQRERCSVLLIDDEPRVLESLRLVLDGVHDVTAVLRAPEAMRLLCDAPDRFDVVLCDLSMAEIDGVSFFEEMSRRGIGDRFVVMTGGAWTPRAWTFLERRVCPVIEKPFMFHELLRVIDDVGETARSEES